LAVYAIAADSIVSSRRYNFDGAVLQGQDPRLGNRPSLHIFRWAIMPRQIHSDLCTCEQRTTFPDFHGFLRKCMGKILRTVWLRVVLNFPHFLEHIISECYNGVKRANWQVSVTKGGLCYVKKQSCQRRVTK